MPHYLASTLKNEDQRDAVELVGGNEIGGRTGLRQLRFTVDFAQVNAQRATDLTAGDTIELTKMGLGDVVVGAMILNQTAAGAAATLDLEIDFPGAINTKKIFTGHNINQVPSSAATGQTLGSSSTFPDNVNDLMAKTAVGTLQLNLVTAPGNAKIVVVVWMADIPL